MQYVKLLLSEADPDPVAMASSLSPKLLGVNSQRISDGFTPLHCASASGDVPLVQDLLARGADPTAKYDTSCVVRAL